MIPTGKLLNEQRALNMTFSNSIITISCELDNCWALDKHLRSKD